LQFYDVGPVPTGKGQTELEIRPGDFVIVNARSIRARTLWQIASEAGRKMIIINVPMTYPPTPINGIMITGLLTPPGSTHFTYPPELAASLKGYEIDLSPGEKDYDFPDKRWLIERQRAILEKRWKTSSRLMEEFDWDLFTVVFTGTDRLQHRFWRCLDPAANGDPAELKEYYGLLEEYYERLDWMVGDLVQRAGEDVYTIILSDHGFGPMPQRQINTHLLLRALGVADHASGSNWAIFLRSSLNRVGLDARNRQKYLGKVIPRAWLRKAEQVGLERVWSVSKARIVTLHTYVGGIWINVKGDKGKERVIERDTYYQELRNQLISKLQELQDPISGAKIVSNVFKREELYTGELLRKIPDLVFVLSSNYKLSGGAARSDSFVSGGAASSAIQGDHLSEGILMISGGGVRNSRSQTDFRIEDVTATILYLLGIPIPTDMDGRVVLDAFDKDFLRDNPIEFVKVSPSSELSKIDASSPLWEFDEDQRSVEERLRSLGYLD
jgi:predicted AlkP superfamily phosphohydrolase/phosphomutase